MWNRSPIFLVTLVLIFCSCDVPNPDADTDRKAKAGQGDADEQFLLGRAYTLGVSDTPQDDAEAAAK
jgi:hypothetical protein